jgi:hypothetical protein
MLKKMMQMAGTGRRAHTNEWTEAFLGETPRAQLISALCLGFAFCELVVAGVLLTLN